MPLASCNAGRPEKARATQMQMKATAKSTQPTVETPITNMANLHSSICRH